VCIAAVKSTMIIATLLGFMAAAQAQAPVVDIEQTCRTAASAMVRLMAGSSMENDQKACLNSEQRARESIVKDWATFSAADRALCVQTEVYLPSYVEWLTCLEMNRDVRKMRAEETGAEQTNPYAPVTLPIVRPSVLY